MWKKNEETSPQPATATPERTAFGATEPRRAAPGPAAGSRAVLGDSIRVQGDISGDEDLLIQGEVDGNVRLESHSVTIGRSGRVKADIHGRNISVEGKVQGNLFADEQVVVRESGEVRGNITAPRVSLEDGAKFKGAIDMEPRPAKAAATTPAAAGTSSSGASSAGGGEAAAEAGAKGAQGGGSASASPRAAAGGGQGKG
ncbi:MAG TPA: polymer-forming cytoskeletal protein [Thermoanaerobaculia bacterium]|nr:polymer-forming cytoskeletal protein [Thermoanaerobaculia bacterium]